MLCSNLHREHLFLRKERLDLRSHFLYFRCIDFIYYVIYLFKILEVGRFHTFEDADINLAQPSGGSLLQSKKNGVGMRQHAED